MTGWALVRPEAGKWARRWAVLECGVLQLFKHKVFGKEDSRISLLEEINSAELREGDGKGSDGDSVVSCITLRMHGRPVYHIKSEHAVKWLTPIRHIMDAKEAMREGQRRIVHPAVERRYCVAECASSASLPLPL